MTKPLIAITMGDPAGIGPEVCLQLIHDRSTLQQCVPIIFGDADVLSHVAALGEFAPPEQVISIDEWPTRRDAITSAAVLDLAAIDVEGVRPGNVSKATGMASYKYIEASITAALEGQVDAMFVAGPAPRLVPFIRRRCTGPAYRIRAIPRFLPRKRKRIGLA